jgi:hypothetical protein
MDPDWPVDSGGIQMRSARFNELDVGGIVFIALWAYGRNSEGPPDFYTFPIFSLKVGAQVIR